MFDALAYVGTLNRIGMMNYYQTQDEGELNNIDKFQEFLLKLFNNGSETEVPLDFESDPLHETVFFQTLSQVDAKVFD